jgi:hypothetical protein
VGLTALRRAEPAPPIRLPAASKSTRDKATIPGVMNSQINTLLVQADRKRR